MCEMASTSTTTAFDGKWQVEANQGEAEEGYGEGGEREGRRRGRTDQKGSKRWMTRKRAM